jgi:hypothetical protein
VSFETTHQHAADCQARTAGGRLPETARPGRRTSADASAGLAPALAHYDLAVRHASEEWTKIRWSLFVFPDITDVAPTDDPGVVRIFYEGRRPYANVWRAALLQGGFDVPALDADAPCDASSPPARPARLRARGRGAAAASGVRAMHAIGHYANGHRSPGDAWPPPRLGA